MKGKFAIDIKAALSLIRAENVSALRELVKKILYWFFKQVPGQISKTRKQ
jgi:hypothetical protein